MSMYGKDYAQIVDTDTEDRLSEIEEVKDAIGYVQYLIQHSSRNFRDEHLDLIGFCEEWIDGLTDEAHYLEEDIKEQLDSVDSTWCD